MTNFDKLLENNKRFAATDFSEHLPEIPFIPNQQVYVLTCIDPRVDPAATLGLRLGDAIVARTVGGRANQSFLDDLAWISYLHETVTPDADWFELAVIHHTDCGSALMADDKLRRGFLQRGFEEIAPAGHRGHRSGRHSSHRRRQNRAFAVRLGPYSCLGLQL